MEIKNVKRVRLISKYNSLARVICEYEDLKSNYRKYEIFFIDRNNQVVAFFENTEDFIVEQLLENNEHLFHVMIYADKNRIHQIIQIKNGKQVLLNTYDEIEDYVADGTFAVKKDGLWGFIDAEGNEIITPQYERCSNFENGIAIIEKNSNRGYINKKGEEITPLKYWKCNPFYGDITIARTHDLITDVIDKNGKILFKSKPRQDVFNLGNGSILVENEPNKFEIVKISNRRQNA